MTQMAALAFNYMSQILSRNNKTTFYETKTLYQAVDNLLVITYG